MAEAFFVAINRVLAVYALLLIVFGTLGNLFSFAICMRGNLRKTPTFIFLAFMLITDTISLYFWNLNHFVSPFFGYVIDGINIHWCKFFIIFQLFSLQASSWLLIGMSFERYLSVKLKTWRTSMFSSKKAAVVSAGIVSMAFVFNFHQAFTIDYVAPLNKTYDNGCYGDKMHQFWQYIHVYFYSLIPFGFLAVFNILLIFETITRSNRIAHTATTTSTATTTIEAKRKAMSYTIVMITCTFIVCSLPTTVAGGYFLGVLLSSEQGYSILLFCDSFAFSYHALNFIVFLLTNKQFSREFRTMFYNLVSLNLTGLNRTVTLTRTNMPAHPGSSLRVTKIQIQSAN